MCIATSVHSYVRTLNFIVWHGFLTGTEQWFGFDHIFGMHTATNLMNYLMSVSHVTT